MTRYREGFGAVAVLLPALLLTLVLTGCASGASEIEPPEIVYGQDVCVECQMIISDPRFAAAYVHEVAPERYESLAFDDIGELFVHADKNPDHNVVAWYVHDHDTEAWLDATEAHFVFSEDLHTPMAQGTAAFGALEAAEAMAGELGGEVLTWDGVRARYDAGELTGEMDFGHMEESGGD